jgi:TonB family protein
MTFQRSLFISIGVHILLFGSALAFAQYGYILGRSDTITVILVGAGQASEKGLRKTKASLDSESEPSRKTVHMKEASSTNDSERPQFDSTTVNTSTGDNQRAATTGEGIAEQYFHNRKSSGETGSPFGLITPDQWQIIQAALDRAKNYPRMARERGIEGVVHVRFKVLPSGNVENVEISKSSGSEILDVASIKTVYRSGPFPRVSGWVEVPISYSIIR